MYIGSEDTTTVKQANELEVTTAPQMHLSGTDGEMVSDATQVVFHKNKDGSLFIEVFMNKNLEKYISYFMFDFDETAKKKLTDFLNDSTTYAE